MNANEENEITGEETMSEEMTESSVETSDAETESQPPTLQEMFKQKLICFISRWPRTAVVDQLQQFYNTAEEFIRFLRGQDVSYPDEVLRSIDFSEFIHYGSLDLPPIAYLLAFNSPILGFDYHSYRTQEAEIDDKTWSYCRSLIRLLIECGCDITALDWEDLLFPFLIEYANAPLPVFDETQWNRPRTNTATLPPVWCSTTTTSSSPFYHPWIAMIEDMTDYLPCCSRRDLSHSNRAMKSLSQAAKRALPQSLAASLTATVDQPAATTNKAQPRLRGRDIDEYITTSMSSLMKYQSKEISNLSFNPKDPIKGKILSFFFEYLERHHSFVDLPLEQCGQLLLFNGFREQASSMLVPSREPSNYGTIIDLTDSTIRQATISVYGFLTGTMLEKQLLTDVQRRDLFYVCRHLQIGNDSILKQILTRGFLNDAQARDFLDPSMVLPFIGSMPNHAPHGSQLLARFVDACHRLCSPVTRTKENEEQEKKQDEDRTSMDTAEGTIDGSLNVLSNELKKLRQTMRACFLVSGHGVVDNIRYAINTLHVNPNHYVPMVEIPYKARPDKDVSNQFDSYWFEHVTWHRIYDEILTYRFYELKYWSLYLQRDAKQEAHVLVALTSDSQRWCFGQRVIASNTLSTSCMIEGWTVLHMMAATYVKRCDHRFAYLVDDCKADELLYTQGGVRSKLPYEIAIERDTKPIINYYLEQVFGRLIHINDCIFQENQLVEVEVDSDEVDDKEGKKKKKVQQQWHVVHITPLMLVSRLAHEQSTKFLIKKCEVDVNVKDSDGETVLMRAIKANRIKEIEILFKVTRKNQISLTDCVSKEGKTLLEVLEERHAETFTFYWEEASFECMM